MSLNEQLMDDCIWKASKIILRHEITMDDYSGELTIGKKTYLVIPKEQMENQLKIYAKAIELYIESLSPKTDEVAPFSKTDGSMASFVGKDKKVVRK